MYFCLIYKNLHLCENEQNLFYSICVALISMFLYTRSCDSTSFEKWESLCFASIEWWEKNPNILPDDSKVAPWVAADLAGALVGEVTGAISFGKLNGKSVLAGAVSGSTGAVGKGAKLISKILWKQS